MRALHVLRTLTVVVAVSACGADEKGDAPAAPVMPSTSARPVSVPRVRATPEAAAPVAVPAELALAAGILRDGADAIPETKVAEHDDREGEDRAGERSFDVTDTRSLRRFLEHPGVNDAVQFGCCVYSHPEEDGLVAAMTQARDEVAVVALAVLVRVRAPRETEDEWRALCRLELRHGDDPAWSGALRELRVPFTPHAIEDALRPDPPADPYGGSPALEWAARAAGVTRHVDVLPRLVELSRGSHLDVSLAAERSLEDFPGPDGDRALAECLLGWQYDAYVRAGRALGERNPQLLEKTLVGAAVPEGARYQAGLLLASVGNAAAVPHLCASVGQIAIVDGKMFDAIEKLATEEQLPLVDALPSSVRGEQRARAKSVAAAVHARLGR